METELNKIIKEKHNKLKGLNNIAHCVDKCTVNYTNNNAIIKHKNNEFIIEHEFIGIFDITTHIWYWSFGFQFKNFDKINIAKQIKKTLIAIVKGETKKYNNLKPSQSDIELMTYFTKNGINLKKESLEFLIKLCIVISDLIWIIPYKNDNNITFIGIKKILNSK